MLVVVCILVDDNIVDNGGVWDTDDESSEQVGHVSCLDENAFNLLSL